MWTIDSFKYLDSVLKKDTAIEKQVNEEKHQEIKYFIQKKNYGSKLITRSSEMIVYKHLIRPVVRYGCDIWVLKGVVDKY